MAAITPVKQVLENGSRSYVATYTAQFASADTFAEYTAADPTSAGDMGVTIAGNTLYPGTSLKIWRLAYNITAGVSVNLVWDATSPQTAWSLTGFGDQSFVKQGGLYVPQSAGAPITGATGKILFDMVPSTVAVSTGTFTIEMWLKKDIQQ